MGEGNGDRMNRQIQASAAYANLSRDVQDLRHDLLDKDDGVLPRIEATLDALKSNPMIRIGLAFKTGKRAAIAVFAFAATCVGIGAGVRQIFSP